MSLLHFRVGVPNVILSLLHSPVTCPYYMRPMCVMTPPVRGALREAAAALFTVRMRGL